MSKAKGYPQHQEFNISGRRNQTKKNAWWQHPPYHNNKTQKSQ